MISVQQQIKPQIMKRVNVKMLKNNPTKCKYLNCPFIPRTRFVINVILPYESLDFAYIC